MTGWLPGPDVGCRPMLLPTDDLRTFSWPSMGRYPFPPALCRGVAGTLNEGKKPWPSLSALCCYCCSVAKPCPTLCNPMDCSTPGSPVLYYLPEFAQTHVHWVGDAILPSHPLSPPSLSAFNFFQHQGFFQWVSSLHKVARVLEFQLQHQSFQWIFRVEFL